MMPLMATLLLLASCEVIKVHNRGSSMEPLLTSNQEISIRRSICVKPKRGDLVVFKTAASSHFIVKKLVSIKGDHFTISNKRMIVNGKTVLAPSGKEYILNDSAEQLLRPYQSTETDFFLVVGKPGSHDSTKIGPISERAIVGTVVGN